MYERELISHTSTNTAQIEKSSASLRRLSLNSWDIFKPAGRSVAKSLFTFAFHPPPTARRERMFPHALRHNKASGKKLQPKGEDALTHPKWHKVRDVFLRIVTGLCAHVQWVWRRTSEFKAWREKEKGRFVCVCVCVCVSECVYVTGGWLVVYSFHKQPHRQRQRIRRACREGEEGILRLICPASVRVHHSTQGPSCPPAYTHTHTHTQRSTQ